MSLNKAYVTSTQVASSTPFDNTTGKGYVGSDVQTALEELRDHTIYDSRTQATTTNGTLTLTVSDTTLQFITGSATGYSVVLPDATTLSIGQHYKIDNTSSQSLTVKDGSGAILFSLSQGSIGEMTLQLNGTAAGTWVYWQTLINVATGIITYNVVSTTAFSSSANADTLITGFTVTPQAGTYIMWVNMSGVANGSGKQITATIYKGGVAITNSIRQQALPAGSNPGTIVTQTISQFDGTQACDVRIDPQGNSMTIGARSLLLMRTGS